jgi:hypothetical protein
MPCPPRPRGPDRRRRAVRRPAGGPVVCEFNEIRRPAAGGAAGLVEIHDLLAARGFRLFMIQNDYVVPDRNYFAVRNALFVLA